MGKERARALRKNSTDAERKLWNALRAGRLGGFKFRRQHQVGHYYVDFICLEQELVVEVDGNHHAEQVAYDEERDLWLEGQNLEVLRFSNQEVLTDIEHVEQVIWQTLTSLSPTLPQRGEGAGVRGGAGLKGSSCRGSHGL